MSDDKIQLSVVTLHLFLQSIKQNYPEYTDDEVSRIGNMILKGLAEKIGEGFQPAAVKVDPDGSVSLVAFSAKENDEFSQNVVDNFSSTIESEPRLSQGDDGFIELLIPKRKNEVQKRLAGDSSTDAPPPEGKKKRKQKGE